MTSEILHGDCREILRKFPDNYFDSCCCDPPYDLTSGKKGGTGEASLNLNSPAGRSRITTGGFMGKEWDGTGVAFDPATWQEVLRVLKPGGHLLAFGGTRTYHRMACAIEDAGFEIRDSLHWIYGSGFPKSLDVSKAIDKQAGAEREYLGEGKYSARKPRPYDGGSSLHISEHDPRQGHPLTAPASAEAKQWEGYGTALKPAHEPVVVARKPLTGTVAANVLQFGTGALNIDGCRIAHVSEADKQESVKKNQHADFGSSPRQNHIFGDMSQEPPGNYDGSAGRFPPNILLSEDAAAEMDRQSGNIKGGVSTGKKAGTGFHGNFGAQEQVPSYADTGGSSRFFPIFKYNAKAPQKERPKVDGIAHPTCKPLELMRWLVKLVTPPGGLCLDPFAGSGTTGQACRLEGFSYVLIEREEDYIKLINARMYQEPTLFDDF